MLAKYWRASGDSDSAHKLVSSHLRLVAKIAMGYRGYGLPISKVVSEGNVGLMQAVKRFEPDKGFRLATYAMWWIKASIQEHIMRSWSLIKISSPRAYKTKARSGPLSVAQLMRGWSRNQSLFQAEESHSTEGRITGLSGATNTQVDISVFSPPRVSAGVLFFVQVLIHDRRELIKAARLAAAIDPSTNRRAFATLLANVGRSSTIELYLDSQQLLIENPVQTIRWEGDATQVIFRSELIKYSIPADVPITGVIHAGIPIGEISFEIMVSHGHALKAINPEKLAPAKRAPTPRSEPMGTAAERYKTAFISYSRKDFEKVSLFAQGLEEAEMKVCVDIISLEPGDEWAEKLANIIKSCDVFYLMWSDNAASSKWVEVEAREAVQLYDRTKRARPRIKPVPLEQPWPAPPDFLRRFHFYSVWHSHRAAQKVASAENH